MSASIFDTVDPEILEVIKSLRLMDDDLMTVVFDGDNEATEFILRIILGRDDLRVKRCMTQKEKRNLFGRSAKLDIIAEDKNHQQYSIEVQQLSRGASPKRVRYIQSIIDSHTLKKNNKYEDLPELYIIFITENDYLGYQKPIYKVNKFFDQKDKNGIYLPFNDCCNIIYVNGEYRGDDALGRLMHDFCEQNTDKMYYKELADKVRIHKQQTLEDGNMALTLDELIEKRIAKAMSMAEEKRNKTVENLIKMKACTLEQLAQGFEMPLEKVKQLAEKVIN